MTLKKKREDKLFQDLFRLGNHSAWVAPMQKENIEWFANVRPGSDINDIYQDDELIKQRMSDLVNLGANPKDKTYLVANVNRPELLTHAYKLGADPNMTGKTGLSVCYRAISRGRTDIARITIEQPNFDFFADCDPSVKGRNILMATVGKGRIDLANTIINAKPEIALLTDSFGNTVFNEAASLLLYVNKPPVSKILMFVNNVCDIHFENNSLPPSNTVSPEINTLLAEKFAHKLAKDMAPQSDANTSSVRTIKI